MAKTSLEDKELTLCTLTLKLVPIVSDYSYVIKCTL